MIYLCDNCGFAVNREIKNEYPKCPECGGEIFSEKKAIEVGNIFKLGAKYSSAFGFEVAGSDGCKLPVLMGCYGIGLTRVMGTIAETNHDESGLVWPKSAAPFLVHLLELESRDGEAAARVKEAARKIYDDLQKRGVSVLYDDREGKSAGEKFKDADLLGIPCRIVVSEKTLAKNSIELKKRAEKESELIGLEGVADYNF